MKKTFLLSLLFIFTFNVSANSFFDRFDYQKGYDTGYAKGNINGFNDCWKFKTMNDNDPVKCMIAMYATIFVGFAAFIIIHNYFVDSPKNILLTHDLLRNELRELKLVHAGKPLDQSFLKQFDAVSDFKKLEHFKNNFPRLSDAAEVRFLQILQTMKTVLQNLHQPSEAIYRHELYHQVNELYRMLAEETSNNDLGKQIKEYLKMDDDIIQFLMM